MKILLISGLIYATFHRNKPKLTTYSISNSLVEKSLQKNFSLENNIVSKTYSVNCSYLAAIIHKIFKANSSFHIKQRTAGKV